MRIAIDNGLANSTSFFRLAVAQQRAGRPTTLKRRFKKPSVFTHAPFSCELRTQRS
jgi:hypothetical protein